MVRTKRTILISAAGLVLVASISYLVAFKASGSGGRVSGSTPVLVPVEVPEAFKGYGTRDLALTDSTLWLLADNGHDPNLILKSVDLGASWEVVSLPTEGFGTKKISFPDANNGWAVGSYGTIVHTSDGGKSWELLKRPTEEDLVSVSFVNDKVGYIGGSKKGFDRANDRMVYGAVILRTTDGGQSWRTCYEDDQSRYGASIDALSETYALVSVDHDLVTEDGGNTWQPIDAQGRMPGSTVFTADGIGHGVTLRGSFYKSLDKGKTWQKLTGIPDSLLNKEWWSIDFADASHGMVVGNNGAIAVTSDGGTTWSEVKSGIRENLEQVRFRGQTGFIVGAHTVYRLERF
jgi:photosystem II stability/assembly factor-like uncharacterized protein